MRHTWCMIIVYINNLNYKLVINIYWVSDEDLTNEITFVLFNIKKKSRIKYNS